MDTLKQSAKTIATLHDHGKLKALMKTRPEGTRYVAVNRHKCALIFYKNALGVFYADYGNKRGWEAVRQVCLRELIEDLRAVSFILCEADDLDQCLAEAKTSEEPVEIDAMVLLNSQVDSQVSRIALRRDAEGDATGYWQGQYDCIEIVQGMIRNYL